MRSNDVLVRRLIVLLAVFVMLSGISLQAQIVISQIYGGGGNAGATYKNDYIEVFNRGTAAQSLAGYSVQYASSTGSSWAVTNLSGTLQPGQYYLIQEAAGAGGTVDLPTPDATGSINMSATTGKVALLSTTAAATGTCPTANVVDFIGFGAANCSETNPTGVLTNTTAALRAGAGCTDTNNNLADFVTSGGPAPRNSSTTLNPCSGTQAVTITTASPLPAGTIGQSYSVTFAATGGTGTGYVFSQTSGTLPPGLTLSGGVLSGVPTSNAGSPYSFNIHAVDSGSNSADKLFSLTVNSASTPPTGVGAASPNSLQEGNSTRLTVTVTPGTNPTSTGITVVGNLNTIGGSSTQQFYDDGTHGDLTAGDNVFSFLYTIPSGTSTGVKSLPVTVADAQSRNSSTSISLTVQPPPPPTTVKISQVYGGGGNSGTTYTNDFIEIFNQSNSPVNISGWSVQYRSASDTGSVWQSTEICPTGTCMIQPGRYFLVQEGPGAGGTTAPPAPDASGGIMMSSTNARVALVASNVLLSTTCPSGGTVVDMVGYGSAVCFETQATPALTNLTAAIRKGNGCIDTDNNRNDFLIDGPIPRNSASPANYCGGDPAQLSGNGLATPDSIDSSTDTLLTVAVTPATTPASTGIAVTADLSNIGGASSVPMHDDGLNGDVTAGDKVYSLEAAVGPFIPTGAKGVPTTITDSQGRNGSAPITLTVVSPTCGVERWAVKTGTDADAGAVDLSTAIPTTITSLRGLATPDSLPDNNRIVPTEERVFVVNATMVLYKKETDVDYHIVLQDAAGNTLVTEIPLPGCAAPTSPFLAGITAARANFDAHFTATTTFTAVSQPVQVKGVGFFDFIHGQTGVAPNGIEIHPILEINFTSTSTTTVVSNLNPSQFGQPVTFTATVTNGGSPAPTGHVTFLDGATPINTAVLNAAGQASFTTSSLSVGPHTITVSYEGDSTSTPGTSAPLTQTVNKADQTITFSAIANHLTTDAPFTVSASASSGLAVTYSIVSGPATISGNTITLTGATGTVVVGAAQAGNGNYNPASATTSFSVSAPYAQLIASASVVNTGSGYVVTLTVKNSGNVDASAVTLITAKLGTPDGTPLPQSLGSIAGNGGTATTTVNFPTSAGSPGSLVAGKFTVSSSVGTFTTTLKIVLPAVAQ